MGAPFVMYICSVAYQLMACIFPVSLNKRCELEIGIKADHISLMGMRPVMMLLHCIFVPSLF